MANVLSSAESEQEVNTKMGDASDGGESDQKKNDVESDQQEDDAEDGNAFDGAESSLKTNSWGWIFGSKVRDLDNDDFHGVGQEDGPSAIKYPVGGDPASVLKQLGPWNRSNMRLLNEFYVEGRRDAFIVTYQRLRKMNNRLQSRLVEIQISGVDFTEYLYATKFLAKVLNASTAWLAYLEERIKPIPADTKECESDHPQDGKLVQNLVKSYGRLREACLLYSSKAAMHTPCPMRRLLNSGGQTVLLRLYSNSIISVYNLINKVEKRYITEIITIYLIRNSVSGHLAPRQIE
jgi:hypothetical protein